MVVHRRLLPTILFLVLTPGLAMGDDWGVFEVSGLRCIIGNNAEHEAHRAGYNGVFSLSTPYMDESPFVPKYAGLNLEHYFDTGPTPEDAAVLFEPRRAPMRFTRIDDATAELYQPPTPHYAVESWTRFTLHAPHYVDMHFRCVPHEDTFAGKVMGVFWASYINGPHDKSFYFLEGGASLDEPRWVQHCTPLHDHGSTVRADADELRLDWEAPGDTLYSAFSPLTYGVPFFYGRFRDHVLIYIFKPGPLIRFAHSPTGGGSTGDGTATNPAWDFQMLVPHPETGTSYALEMRLVYKTWAGRDDVIAEVRRYLGEQR